MLTALGISINYMIFSREDKSIFNILNTILVMWLVQMICIFAFRDASEIYDVLPIAFHYLVSTFLGIRNIKKQQKWLKTIND